MEQAQRTPIDPRLQDMLSILHAGGNYGYWWNRDPKTNKKVSEWWQTAQPTNPTNGIVDAYFGVHPVVQIPPTNQHGESVPAHAVRSQIKYIAAINALFGEYDAKDYPSKADALAAAEAVNPAASIIIDSGGGYHCVPLDTEILTRSGWKTYDNVLPGESVLGYNTKTGMMEWTIMLGKIIKEQDDLVLVKNGIFEAYCTPDHKWVCDVTHGHQGGKLSRNQLVPARSISRRRHKVRLSAPMKSYKGMPITPNEAAILGWIVTDGSIAGDMVRINQTERKYADEIRALLRHVPHSERYDHRNTDCPDMVTWHIRVHWVREIMLRAGLTWNKHGADWTTFVLNLSNDARAAFLDAAWKGDGTVNHDTKVLVQNAGNIAEALKLAVFLEGNTPLVARYDDRSCETIRYGKPFATWNMSVTPAGASAVWCPQTQLGTWVMKQGDTICITGNCYWLLDSTWDLHTDEDREKAKDVQSRWVDYVGADTASKDLARVLRIPGTHNLKYPDKPIVQFVKYDINALYDVDALIALLPEAKPEPLNYGAAPSVDAIDDRRLAAYLDRALREEIANVALAGDGLKHHTLRDAAVKVGSLIPHGLNEEAAFNGLYNAISGRAKDVKNAADTIRDGLAYGKKSPRDISKLASLEPGFDSDGVPHCPQCGDTLFYAQTKDIWGCKECINANKPYWWRGNGYTPPPFEAQLPDDHVDGFTGVEDVGHHVPVELTDEAPALPFEIDFTEGQGAGRWLDLYVDYASQVSPMTPRMFHETAALWLVSVGIARRLRVKMNFANIYPNLFILWVARSTVWGKSTAMDIAIDTANRVFPHLLSPHDITPEALLSDMSGKEPRNFKELSDEALQMWRAERNFCAQRGLAIDEISGFLAKAQKDYNAGLIEAFLKFYDCADHKGSTKSEGRIWVRNTYVSVLGASTPVMMAQHFKNAQLAANGWWYRFIIATPEVDKPEYIENPEHISEPPYLHTWLHSIYERLPQAGYPSPVEPLTLTLTPDVMVLWKQFDKAMRYDLQEGDFDDRYASAYGRMPTLAIKVATILAAMDWGENMPQPVIKYRHMVRAIEMCEQWRRSLHRAMGASTASNEKALRDRILRQVARFDDQGGVKMADLSNLMKDVEYAALKAAVLECIELQHIEEVLVPTGGKGRPSKKYRLPR